MLRVSSSSFTPFRLYLLNLRMQRMLAEDFLLFRGMMGTVQKQIFTAEGSSRTICPPVKSISYFLYFPEAFINLDSKESIYTWVL